MQHNGMKHTDYVGDYAKILKGNWVNVQFNNICAYGGFHHLLAQERKHHDTKILK